jgi:hypothetical protein
MNMKYRLTLFLLLLFVLNHYSQTEHDTLVHQQERKLAEDPTQFLSRVELFNEYQHFINGINLNITTLRSVVKLGKRFTSRIDIPIIYNSKNTTDDKQFGLSDISFRLVGYKIYQSKREAITLSIEVSLNTAQSPLLGSGKNVFLFMGSYTRFLIPKRLLFAGTLQQANSFSGDAARSDLSFSKIQVILLCFLSKKSWVVLTPEYFMDYTRGQQALNLEARFAYAPMPKLNIWAKTGVGIFGDFITRYQWTAEVGLRRFF